MSAQFLSSYKSVVNRTATYEPSARLDDATTLSSVRGSTEIPEADFSGLIGGSDMGIRGRKG